MDSLDLGTGRGSGGLRLVVDDHQRFLVKPGRAVIVPPFVGDIAEQGEGDPGTRELETSFQHRALRCQIRPLLQTLEHDMRVQVRNGALRLVPILVAAAELRLDDLEMASRGSRIACLQCFAQRLRSVLTAPCPRRRCPHPERHGGQRHPQHRPGRAATNGRTVRSSSCGRRHRFALLIVAFLSRVGPGAGRPGPGRPASIQGRLSRASSDRGGEGYCVTTKPTAACPTGRFGAGAAVTTARSRAARAAPAPIVAKPLRS